MIELEKPKFKKALYYCGDPLLTSSFGWTLDNLGIPSFAANDRRSLVQKLASGSWDYIFFPADCASLVKNCIQRSGLKTIPVLLGSPVADDNRSWDGLTVTYPYYAVSVANAFEGRKNLYRWNGKISFVCPSIKVLIVDDLDINLKIAQGLLAPYGLQVTSCRNSIKALDMIQKNNFDLVFLDQMMPEMDGDELVKSVRSLQGRKYQNIPVIAMTANAASGIREIFLEKGYSDYVSKPLETYQLNELLERWIDADKRRSLKLQDYPSLSIKGLDENIGMASCFQSRETFRKLLHLYCSDLDYRLNILNEAANTERKLTKEQELSLLSNLHILKSSCETIGAISFATTVSEMELDVRQDQKNAKHFSRFIEELGAFKETILKVLKTA